MRDAAVPNGGTEAAAADAAAAASGSIVHPIVQGSIADWDVLEACLDHILYERVGAQRRQLGAGPLGQQGMHPGSGLSSECAAWPPPLLQLPVLRAPHAGATAL